MTAGLGTLNGHLVGQFAASIAPIYFTFALGLGYCFTDVLKLDMVPAISVIIQYVCLPALLFRRLAKNDPSELDLKLLGADALSKFIPLAVLLVWWAFFSKLGKVQSLEWVVTFWMLATLPNTVLIGDQILTPMFSNDVRAKVQNETTTIIFAQSLYWYNFVIFLYEIREMFIEDELGKNPIVVDTAVPGEDELTELEKQQRMHAVEEMEKSRVSGEMGGPSSVWEPNRSSVWEPNRPSLTWEPNRPSVTWEQHRLSMEIARPSWEIGRPSWSKAPYDAELNDYSIGSYTPNSLTPRSMNTPGLIMTPSWMTPNYRVPPSRVMGLDRNHSMNSVTPGYLERDHSIRSITPGMTPSWMTPNYRVPPRQVMGLDRNHSMNSVTPGCLERDHSIRSITPGMTPSWMTPNYRLPPSRVMGLDRNHSMNSVTPGYLERDHSIRSITPEMTPGKLDRDQSISMEKGMAPEFMDPARSQMVMAAGPSPSRIKRIAKMILKVVKRMLQVPLLYGSALGFVWSINRWRVPSFLDQSVLLCAESTVGLAMILLGMVCYKFYKGERGFIPCGQKLLWAGFALRFLFGPIIMYLCSMAFNIKGYLLDYAILQVIVPQGSMTFALAQIYGCKLEVITPAEPRYPPEPMNPDSIYVQMIVFVPFILADFALLSNV